MAEIRSADPVPISKMNLSPFPSSSSQHDAACFGRAVGMPVPQATNRISSGPRTSLLGA